MNWFLFILLALATHRLSTMLSKELGPGRLFERIRRLVKRKSSKKSGMKEGISCPWCVSIWFATLITIGAVFFLTNPIFNFVVLVLAISDAAVILNQAFTRDK